MKNILMLTTLSVLLFACGNATSDKKSELENLKKEQVALADKIKKLELEIAKTDTTNKIKMLDVEVTPVTAMAFKSYLQVQGKLDAEENVNVSAQMGGTVKSIYVKEGDNVKAGQILAELDDAVMRQGIEELKNQLAFATDLYNKQKICGIKKSEAKFNFYRQKITRMQWRRKCKP